MRIDDCLHLGLLFKASSTKVSLLPSWLSEVGEPHARGIRGWKDWSSYCRGCERQKNTAIKQKEFLLLWHEPKGVSARPSSVEQKIDGKINGEIIISKARYLSSSALAFSIEYFYYCLFFEA
jgi:hypothetical protein